MSWPRRHLTLLTTVNCDIAATASLELFALRGPLVAPLTSRVVTVNGHGWERIGLIRLIHGFVAAERLLGYFEAATANKSSELTRSISISTFNRSCKVNIPYPVFEEDLESFRWEYSEIGGGKWEEKVGNGELVGKHEARGKSRCMPAQLPVQSRPSQLSRVL